MTTNGADRLVSTLADAGVDTCFTNPGTTEMHLVAALGREPRVSSYLCLFEGVATGAADGFARMSGRPAMTLLHLGPGFANGMANLHNAKKAASPVINVVGDHATHHKRHDAPLAADIEGMARPVSDWVRTAGDADEVARLAAEAAAFVRGPDGSVATLAVPNDVAWTETSVSAAPANVRPLPGYDPGRLAEAAASLRRGRGGLLVIGGAMVSARAARLAHEIEAFAGCRVVTEAAVARMQRGGGTPPLRRIPFHVDMATGMLGDVEAAVLAGARDPVAFFAYPGRPSRLLPAGVEPLALSPPGSDPEATLEALHGELGAPPAQWAPPPLAGFSPRAPITPDDLGLIVAAALPENAVVVDESITSGGRIYPDCASAPRHDWINNRGGSIGYSMPVGIGCAVACPDRKIVCLVSDGSAFYTLQALWTMARYRLDVTAILLANRSYRILGNEMSKIGAGEPDEHTLPLISLTEPVADWTMIARGHGVEAERAETCGELSDALARAIAEPGPRLVEAVI